MEIHVCELYLRWGKKAACARSRRGGVGFRMLVLKGRLAPGTQTSGLMALDIDSHHSSEAGLPNL